MTRRAIDILTRELGTANAMRFVNQFSVGSGDYTAERQQLFAGRTLAEVVAEIKEGRANPPVPEAVAAGPENSQPPHSAL